MAAEIDKSEGGRGCIECGNEATHEMSMAEGTVTVGWCVDCLRELSVTLGSWLSLET